MGWIENCFSKEMADRMYDLPMDFQPLVAPNLKVQLNDLLVFSKTDRRTPGRPRHLGSVASLTAPGVGISVPRIQKLALWTLPPTPGAPVPGCTVSGKVVHHWIHPSLQDDQGSPIRLDPHSLQLEGWKPDNDRLVLVVGILTATEVRVVGAGPHAERIQFSDIPFAVSVIALGFSRKTGELRLLNASATGFLGAQTYPRNTVRLWPMQMLAILDEGAESGTTLLPVPPLPEPPPLAKGEGMVPLVLGYRNRKKGMLAPSFDAGTTDLKKDGRLIGVVYVANQNGSTTEETLSSPDAPAFRTGAGTKETLAATGSSKKYPDVAAFRAGAWAHMKWPEGTEALYQRAECKVVTLSASGALAKCKSWGVSLHKGSALRVQGKSSGGAALEGWVITGQDVEGADGARKRTIWQIIPRTMMLPPRGEVSMTEVAMETEDLVATMLARLGDVRSSVVYDVATCECVVRYVRNSWQLLAG